MRSLKTLCFLDPKNIENTISISDAFTVFQHLSEININDLDREYRQLRNTDINKNQDILSFWQEVNSKTSAEGTKLFENLIKFVTKILVLPHSSAYVERIFQP